MLRFWSIGGGDGDGDFAWLWSSVWMHLLALLYTRNGEYHRSLPGTVPAVDSEITACHETAGIADQEDGCSSVFFRLAQSAQHILRWPFSLSLGILLEKHGDHLCYDVAWGNGIHADAILTPFGG
jgi:hypothetical protein